MGRPRKTSDARSRFGNVTELPSGKHRARYSFKGDKDSKSFNTATEAWEWLGEVQHKIRRGAHRSPTEGRRLFREVAEELMDAHNAVTRGTWADYHTILTSDLLPFFGHMQIASIDIRDVRRWAKEAGKTRASSTVTKHKGVLSVVFTFAQEMHYRFDNPCSLLRLATGEREEMVFLDQSEILRVAAAMRGEYGLVTRLSAYVGLRAGEIWDLKVGSLDYRGGKIQVVSNVREIPHEKDFDGNRVCPESCSEHGLVSKPSPKNGEWRSARVPERLMVELAQHIKDNGLRARDLVFHSPGGLQVRHSNFREDFWRPTILRLNDDFAASGGVNGIQKEPRFHDLRHTCAALYFGRGSTGEEVRRVLGHSSIQTTHKHYAHIFPEAFDRMIEGLDADIEEAERAFAEATKVVPIRA